MINKNNNQFVSCINNINRSFQFIFDYPKIINALKKYPISFSTNIIFYIFNNKILLNEILSCLPTIWLVESEMSYIEELSKRYGMDIDTFTMGSVLAFFKAVENGDEINEETFINQSWCYDIPSNESEFSGRKVNVYEPYPFSKKEYANSVTFNKLDMEFDKLMKERYLIFFKENNLQKAKQENDQAKRMILMKEINVSPSYIKYLDFIIYNNDKTLLKIQERRILIDYRLADINSKLKQINEENSEMQMIRGKQIYLFHLLKKNGDLIGSWKIKCELEKYETDVEEKDYMIKLVLK